MTREQKLERLRQQLAASETMQRAGGGYQSRIAEIRKQIEQLEAQGND